MTGIFTPAYPVSKRTGSDGLVANQALDIDMLKELAEGNF
jgi:hypothetical protein